MTPYSLLSTTRFDPFLTTLAFNNDPSGRPSPFFLLSYHLDRLLDAAGKHAWQHSLTYHDLKAKCEQAAQQFIQAEGSEACRIRLVLQYTGDLKIFTFATTPFTSDPMTPSLFQPDTGDSSHFDPIATLYLDTRPTPSSIFTSTKTTSRQHYEQARTRAKIPSDFSLHFDVVLYNPQLHITESSICNVAFWRSSKWVTPLTSTGCLPGVTRRWLLEQGRISEAEEGLLTKHSIREGDWVLLMNGVIGCRLGKIAAHPDP